MEALLLCRVRLTLENLVAGVDLVRLVDTRHVGSRRVVCEGVVRGYGMGWEKWMLGPADGGVVLVPRPDHPEGSGA